MATTLVFIEIINGKVTQASRSAITAAQKLNAEKLVGIASQQSSDLATLPLHTIRVVETASTLAEVISAIVLDAAQTFQAESVVVAATALGKGVGPRIAAKYDAIQVSDIIGVTGKDSFKRPMYAGDAIADVTVSAPRRVITVRASAFDPCTESSGALIEKAAAAETPQQVSFVSFDGAGGSRPQLGESSVVVSGGRALGSKEEFERVILPLADKLKAAVGASRAAVDSGYAPNDWQVGQTGKIVAPELYISVGISGAIQHLAGMKDSKVIVAINKDPDAPIFEIADYGLVADLFQAVPELLKAISE